MIRAAVVAGSKDPRQTPRAVFVESGQEAQQRLAILSMQLQLLLIIWAIKKEAAANAAAWGSTAQPICTCCAHAL